MSEIDVITNIDKNIIKSASDLLKDLYKQLQQANEDIKQYSVWLDEAREANKQLEFKYNMLAKQYAKLQEQYQKVLKLAKENADSSEYCLRELEKDYEKATQKLVDIGFWNVKGEYKEDYKLVENLEL